ncbi:hypothetical protein APHAL10511_000383 [Amanita phalloides]|nr:hypothetical protein APHAL10511_000383 [Amanita phalloides]
MFGQFDEKKITDYGDEDVAMVDPDLEKKDAEIDDELGVAVVFDEQEQEDEDEDEDEEGFEIKDESDDEEEEVGAQEAEDEPRDVGEEELVMGGEGKKAKSVKVDKGIVSPHVIGGFWVQRQISEIYPDPVTAADEAAAVLSIPGSESNLRVVENQLREFF